MTSFTFSCNKKDSYKESIELTSPDNTYQLANSTSDLLKMIDVHTDSKGAKNVDKVEFYNFKGNWAALVNYTKSDDSKDAILFSKYILNSQSDELNITKNNEMSLTSDAGGSKTYSYTCSVKPGCDKCQVQVTDPFGNPVVTCTCDKCQLNVKVTEIN